MHKLIYILLLSIMISGCATLEAVDSKLEEVAPIAFNKAKDIYERYSHFKELYVLSLALL